MSNRFAKQFAVSVLAACTMAVALPVFAQTALPQVEAEVRRIDKTTGKISLKHGEIKNLDMPPMSMVFTAREPGLLQGFKVGDKVRFTADKIDGTYTVLTIEAAK